MATFAFTAKSISGKELTGSREASNKFELARALRTEGYILIKAQEGKIKERKLKFNLPSFLQRVSLEEKMLFARNLSVMVGAGLSLARALEVLSEQTTNLKFKGILLNLGEVIRGGGNFSQALGHHPAIFSELFRSMVEAGEKTGKLEDSLKLISHQLKRDYDLRKKIRGAMIYPAIIILAMVGIGAMMLIYVVPTLVSTFEDLNVELPRSTQIIINTSTLFIDNLILSFLTLLLFILGVFFAIRSKKGKEIFDVVILKIPVISGMAKKANAARTARTMGSLISSGVEILETLRITENVLQNHYYKNVLREARSDIEKGSPISKIFQKYSNLYPVLVGEMISVGEETGKLSEMLTRLAIFYEGEVASATKDLSTIIEPALMIIIGVAVGFFAVSMITPLYDVVSSF